MNLNHKIKLMAWFSSIVILFFLSQAYSNTTFEGMEAKGKPIVVNSDMVEIDNKRGILIFSGNVDVRSKDFKIRCSKMILYYNRKKNGSKLASDKVIIDRIVAVDDVSIKRKIGGVATADRAEYFNKERKIILTGNPVVRHGNDFIKGVKITFFLDDDRSIVEGSETEKARAVFSMPSKEKKEE